MSPGRRLVEESTLRIEGPWRHRDISAGGIRLHVVEAGTGPLVLLVHGFPEFWWAWRDQITALAEAGFRVAAPDLRGYGASDKPPRGYDPMTLAGDLAGVIRALGETDAVVVGHDWGGHLGWTMAATAPHVVRRLVVLSVPHPLRWLRVLPTSHEQRRASRYMARFQLPWHPERWMVADGAAHIGELLHAWGGPDFPDPESERRYREAMQILYVPHRAAEYYRWSFRSVFRTDGRRFRAAMRSPITAPTLQLHGSADRCVLPGTAQGSGRYVDGDYEWRLLPGVGHFPHREARDQVTAEILRWCRASGSEGA